MRFFRKVKKDDGWLTIAFFGNGAASATVRRNGAEKPMVLSTGFLEGPAAPEPFEKWAKELQASRYQVSTLLGWRDYQLLTVEAPNVAADELKTAIRWRLKDMLDYHVDDATIDVLDVPVDPNAPARQHSMFAVAARNTVIQQKQALFGEARFGLSVIDIPEMAQRNIAAQLEPDGRGLAMLSIGEDGGLLTLSFRGELYLSRRIDVTPEQVAEEDFERKQATFDKITLELQRSLDHFDRLYNYISVAKLLVAPCRHHGLDSYLSSNLYTPVETFSLADVFDLSAVPALEDIGQQQAYFHLLGAALRLEETAL